MTRQRPRIATRPLRAVTPADLAEHVVLERGVDVAEQDELYIFVGVVQLGLKAREHAELGVARLAGREVRRVPAKPVERLTLRTFNS